MLPAKRSDGGGRKFSAARASRLFYVGYYTPLSAISAGCRTWAIDPKMHFMHQKWADYRVFWRQFRETYHSTGAVMPSGHALSFALCHFVRNGEYFPATKVASPSPRRILEVGPGTGAVTARILQDVRPADQLVLVERNEQFVQWLRKRLDESPDFQRAGNRITLLHAAVEDLPEEEPFDLIISGLPLNNFAVEVVTQIFGKLRRLLAHDGTLSFFEYVAVRRAKSFVSPPADRTRLHGISRLFRDVLAGNEIRRDLVIANMPPAWVHHVRFKAESTEPGAESKTSGSRLPAPGSLLE
jgi:phospholipid N-methyltransferase